MKNSFNDLTKLRSIIALLLMTSFGFLFSCEDDVEISKQPQTQPIEKAHMSLEYFARLVAKSMKEPSMRHAIKEEALKKFDGDYDILYRKFAEKQRNGSAFREQFAINGTSFERTIKRLNKIAADMPLLQIAVPVNIEKWDPDHFTPLVAIMDADYDEATTMQVRAYDSDGNLHMLDAINAPDFPVVVISQNERLVPVAKENGLPDNMLSIPCSSHINEMTPYFSTDQHDYYIKKYINNCGGSGGGSGSTPTCFKDKTWLYLTGMYFTKKGLNKYEGWPAGAPEIDVRVLIPNKDDFSKLTEVRFIDDLEPNKRKDIKNKWWSVPPSQGGNPSLVYWDESLWGETIMMDFVEDDFEAGVKLEEIKIGGEFGIPKVGKITLEYKFKINPKDEHMGKMLVNRCANPPSNIGGSDCWDVSPQKFFAKIGN